MCTNVLLLEPDPSWRHLVPMYIGDYERGAQIDTYTHLKTAKEAATTKPYDAFIIRGTRKNIHWARHLWALGHKVIVLSPDREHPELDTLPPRAGNFGKRLARMLGFYR